MNTRRQTIWLVSMLSLMVILSAYYLFTQDITGKDEVSDATHLENSAEVSSMGENSGTVASNTAEDGSEYTINDADQQVLSQLEKEGYFESSGLSEILTKRENRIGDEENRIMSVLADVTNDSDTSLEAIEEMAQLEEKMEKFSQLENSLMETYEVAVISEEVNDKYKVVVTSDTPEKKQAAEILDRVITELDVRPDQVSVEFVANP
ncbi:hypothetical protein J40TS1_09020 [Paenibacillus montaniterrae]|uniref:SpoIIIAH-like family protein n=1 Tax=Paenibacillus montaniterrae TaxID=429341 RepID=A0A920CWI2_9BACL|nr:SpoIIIAH-like family protein [Paenibacillus montaniterrae]GIP15260.1 hypothetical protein J40TS1_09020 [Paenibacillus montaniterrae]